LVSSTTTSSRTRWQWRSTSRRKETVTRWSTQDGANDHSPILMSTKTCLARVWETRLQDLVEYIKIKAEKCMLRSRVSLMIGAILDLCVVPASKSLTSSWLSDSRMSLCTPVFIGNTGLSEAAHGKVVGL
jgi:hypothetical protein